MAVITGDDSANDLSGTAGADTIYGLGGDDTLRADYRLSGLDHLEGGFGGDLYIVDLTGRSGAPYKAPNIVEGVDQGYDTLRLTYTTDGSSFLVKASLPSNVEYFDVYGAVPMIEGNDLANEIHANLYDLPDLVSQGVQINGGAGDDVIFGSNYNDMIIGDAGADGMAGGGGDDYYVVDNVGDLIVENSNGGHDAVECDGVDYRLPSNVEDMYVYGGGLNYYGNRLSNRIETWDSFSRVVRAAAGDDVVVNHGVADDIVIGGSGNDTLQAGLGDDVYRCEGKFDRDEITDAGGDDAVEFDVNEDHLWFARSGNDLSVSVIGTQNSVTIKNWYSDSTAKIEEFYVGDGKMLTAARVDGLVSAMAAFAPPTTTTLPVNVQTALAPVLQASWH